MMINDQMILEEDYDENYEPTENEIVEYATSIGIDVDTEQHLLWIAREGFNAPLPDNWKPCQTPTGDIYYFNFASGESIWDHPCDEFYKKMVLEERRKGSPDKNNANKKKTKGKEDTKKKKGGVALGSSGSGGMADELGPLTKAPILKTSQLNPINLKADSSLGTPQVHKGSAPFVGSIKSVDSLDGASFLRGSTGNSQQIRGSFNTTSGSMNKSLNVTSSVTIPALSGDYEDDDENFRPGLGFNLQDMAALGYEESDLESDESKQRKESESDSDDYRKEVDFGLDKNLSEKLMELENLEPGLRGSLEKDIDGTLSLKSTARDESPRGKISPLDNEMERRRKAELAALSAERRQQEQFLREEETKISNANEKAIKEMKEKLGRELENTKLELLEDKDRRLKLLKDEIKKEAEEEERKLRAEKKDMISQLQEELKSAKAQVANELSQSQELDLSQLRNQHTISLAQKEVELREQMDKALQKLRDEVGALKREEQDKLEDEKKKALDKLAKQVETSVASEKSKLEEDQKKQLETLRNKHESEIERLKQDLDKQHKEKLNSLKNELEISHKKEMEKLRDEISKLHDAEKAREESELEAAKKRQKAINDLEKGLDEILNERRMEMKHDHETQLTALRREHEEQLRKMREEFKTKIQNEEDSIKADLEQKKQQLQRQHDREVEEMKKNFQVKKECLQDQLDDEEEELKEKNSDLERRKAFLDKSLKSLDAQEKLLEERRKKLTEEKNKLEQDHDVVLGAKVTSLGEAELERMRGERRQLLEELNEEQEQLDKIKSERKTIEGEVIKLKMSRDQQNRKLDEIRKRMDQKLKEFEGLQDHFTQEVQKNSSVQRTESVPAANSKLTVGDLQSNLYMNGAISDEEDFLRDQNKSSSILRPGISWQDVLAADDNWLEPSIPGTRRRGLREHLAVEEQTLSRAKAYLQKQRKTLKQRQSALAAAKQELIKDTQRLREGDMSERGAELLNEVKEHLEREKHQISSLQSQINSGSQLLKQKEDKLHEMEDLTRESVSDDEKEYSPFVHSWSKARLPNLDLSDDDSSGVSSSNASLENFLYGHNKYTTTLGPSYFTSSTAASNHSNDELAKALKKINSELAHVLTFIDRDTGVTTASPERPSHQYTSSSSHHYNHYTGLPDGNLWSPHPPVGPPPRHFSSLVNTAEQSLERKWRKYFGDHRPPYTPALSYQAPSHGLGSASLSIRDRQFRMNFLESKPIVSIQTQLAAQKEWLKQRSRVDNPVKNLHLKTESLHSTMDLNDLQNDTPLVATPPKYGMKVRLELDDQDEIRVRHY
ncbi:centrosomal protein of 164 kDa-like isoform X2 [Biomphalaria glabrata]|uniref:Centrosomal protein of 164 kDa n=1 Tax=Biomphalaria glabrata TaxID=6526 RepID=A0A9W3AKW5_BIOGL|nr:centrosomal protein of 164 kDa-like isoform X2 [Biomphalaria glabrata]